MHMFNGLQRASFRVPCECDHIHSLCQHIQTPFECNHIRFECEHIGSLSNFLWMFLTYIWRQMRCPHRNIPTVYSIHSKFGFSTHVHRIGIKQKLTMGTKCYCMTNWKWLSAAMGNDSPAGLRNILVNDAKLRDAPGMLGKIISRLLEVRFCWQQWCRWQWQQKVEVSDEDASTLFNSLII